MRRRLLGSDSHRLLGLESRRDLILVTAVDVQQVEAIRDRNSRLLGRSDLLPHLRRWRWIGLCAFIHVKVDLLALVPPVALVSADRKKFDGLGYLQATHQALTCVDGIVNRVQADVAVAPDELHLDHHQIMDMVEILANHIRCMSVIVPLDDQVAAGTHGNFASNVAREKELAVAPPDINLLIRLAAGAATQ